MLFMAGDALCPQILAAGGDPLRHHLLPGQITLRQGFSGVDPRRAIKDVDGHNFREMPEKKVLRDNAMLIFNLSDQPAVAKAAE